MPLTLSLNVPNHMMTHCLQVPWEGITPLVNMYHGDSLKPIEDEVAECSCTVPLGNKTDLLSQMAWLPSVEVQASVAPDYSCKAEAHEPHGLPLPAAPSVTQQ